jgi:hypothetical protein
VAEEEAAAVAGEAVEEAVAAVAGEAVEEEEAVGEEEAAEAEAAGVQEAAVRVAVGAEGPEAAVEVVQSPRPPSGSRTTWPGRRRTCSTL